MSKIKSWLKACKDAQVIKLLATTKLLAANVAHTPGDRKKCHKLYKSIKLVDKYNNEKRIGQFFYKREVEDNAF